VNSRQQLHQHEAAGPNRLALEDLGSREKVTLEEIESQGEDACVHRARLYFFSQQLDAAGLEKRHVPFQRRIVQGQDVKLDDVSVVDQRGALGGADEVVQRDPEAPRAQSAQAGKQLVIDADRFEYFQPQPVGWQRIETAVQQDVSRHVDEHRAGGVQFSNAGLQGRVEQHIRRHSIAVDVQGAIVHAAPVQELVGV
jgi:hypothetical protein